MLSGHGSLKRRSWREESNERLEGSVISSSMVTEMLLAVLMKLTERARSLSPEKRDSISRPQTPRSPRNTPRLDRVNSPLASPSILSPPLSSVPQNNAGVVERVPQEKGAGAESRGNFDARSQSDAPPLSREQEFRSPQRTSDLNNASQVRPLSLADRAWSPMDHQATSSARKSGLSRDEISQNLLAKDPSWFRQSGERPERRAGFRRNLEDTEGVHTAQRRALPGMGRPATVATHMIPTDGNQGNLPMPPKSTGVVQSPPSANTPVSNKLLVEPIPDLSGGPVTPSLLEPQILKRPQLDVIDRSTSPTKGLGGFVQSAMKRSDSVSKRWSVHTPSGLSRQGSNASLRDGPGVTPTRLEPLGKTAAVDADVTKTIRGAEIVDASSVPRNNTTLSAGADRAFRHARSESVHVNNIEDKHDENTAPSSPSKQWSPVKSTWLESALSRPSSPQSATASPQPTWLSELNRSKQSKGSDFPRPRNPEMSQSPPDSTKAKIPPARPKPMSSKEKPADTDPEPKTARVSAQEDDISRTNTNDKPGKPAPPAIKPKLKPEFAPKLEFRSNLKTTTTPVEPPKEEELEFRHAFGKLKRMVPEKYNPPDELKENILRGKRDLSPSKGPQVTPRKDELKESLIKQRQNLSSDASASPRSSQAALATRGSAVNDVPQKSNTEEINSVVTLKHATTFPPSGTLSESKPLDRFQSSLASILTRGAPSIATTQLGSSAPPKSQSAFGAQTHAERTPEASSSTPLEHMTKGRARGPKRRLPSTLR